ncbi:MAG: hypothetical protein HPY71_11570 [Firmicutes bacterium]|nr:hypothetical protein [Bacillota bacterium]
MGFELVKALGSFEGQDKVGHYRLPARSDVAKLPFYQEDPWKKEFLNLVPISRTFPPIPMERINESICTHLQLVLYEKVSPDEAGKRFRDDVQRILQTYISHPYP